MSRYVKICLLNKSAWPVVSLVAVGVISFPSSVAMLVQVLDSVEFLLRVAVERLGSEGGNAEAIYVSIQVCCSFLTAVTR